ncbi:hypothetical protein D9M68_897220 [compost metagenome]
MKNNIDYIFPATGFRSERRPVLYEVMQQAKAENGDTAHTGKSLAQKLRQGRFQMLPVIPGISKDGLLQFTASDIDTDTCLVLKNAYSVLMKMKNTEE